MSQNVIIKLSCAKRRPKQHASIWSFNGSPSSYNYKKGKIMSAFKPFIIFVSLIMTSTAFARYSSNNKLTITPIIGVERVQELLPTPMMRTRIIVGAAALYRIPLGTAEAEFTHGQNTTYDSTTSTTYKYVGQKLRLGLRGQFHMGAALSSHLRAGAQLKQNILTKIVSGASSTTSTTTKVDPYLGAGLAIHLFQTFSLTADITAVYTPSSTPELSDFEIQPSVGFNISI